MELLVLGDRLAANAAPYLRELARDRKQPLRIVARDAGLESWAKDPLLDEPSRIVLIGGVENLVRPLRREDQELLFRRLAARHAFVVTVLPFALAPRTLYVPPVPAPSLAWYAWLAGRAYRGAFERGTMGR